jgi:hypothetical protein
MNWIPHIFGIGAMIALFTAYQQKQRGRLLAAKLTADICWSIHYFCLGATAGMIPNCVGIFRELVFVNRGRRKWASGWVWPVLFASINLCLGIWSFEVWYDLLPVCASAFVTMSLWLRNPTLTKRISVPVSMTFLIYNVMVGSVVGAINETVALISLLLFFIKSRKTKEETV